jgi:DNA-binding NarL/FixJ family response regulator
MINIALADDHVLLRNGLANLVASLGYNVVFQADNGKEFIEKLKHETLPDIALMDINMPVMDGHETALWLKKNRPGVKIMALSMYDDESSIIKMFKAGARGYILKDCDPAELKTALTDIELKGFYYSEMVTGTLIHSINAPENEAEVINGLYMLSAKEIEFIKLTCKELTYKEIAEKMCLSPRTIEGYREDVFKKLRIKSRVGLVIYAIKNGLMHV